MAKIDLLAALDSATEKDLAEIDGQLETLAKKLDSLREVRKLLDVRINGKPIRKALKKKSQRAAAPASDDGDNGTSLDSMEGRRVRLANYLEVRGPSKPSIIAADLEIPISSLYAIARDERFEKTADGWKLARPEDDD